MGILELFGARPSMDVFAQRLLARLEQEQPGEWQWRKDDAQLVHEGGGTTNLTNIYLEYAGAPRASRPALLEKYAAMRAVAGREPPGLWEVAAKNVYVVLRSRYDLDISGIAYRGQTSPRDGIVTRPFQEDLELRLVYDFGPSLSTVTPALVETWGRPVDEVFANGVRNLAALPAPTWVGLDDGVFVLESDASYNESFVLVSKVIERLPFAPQAVLLPCNRGVLLAADGRSDAALLAMLEHAIQALQERPWPMTHTALERQGVRWRKLERDGAVGAKLHEFRALSEHLVYRDQKTELDRLHERDGTDLFVATASLMRQVEDGPLQSWSAWSNGVDTLLPRTHLVALLRDPGNEQVQPVMVPWDVLERECAALLESTEESPVRYRVRGFPDSRQWERLMAVAESL